MEKKKSEEPIELSLEQTAENKIPTQAQDASPDTAAKKPGPVPPQYAEDEGEVIDLKSMRPNAGLDMSASQRLRTVRALNAGMGATPPPQKPKAAAPPKEKPVPIEDQIDLSMTATFKALKIDPDALQQQDEEETEKKGFFSRFRKKG